MMTKKNSLTKKLNNPSVLYKPISAASGYLNQTLSN